MRGICQDTPCLRSFCNATLPVESFWSLRLFGRFLLLKYPRYSVRSMKQVVGSSLRRWISTHCHCVWVNVFLNLNMAIGTAIVRFLLHWHGVRWKYSVLKREFYDLRKQNGVFRREYIIALLTEALPASVELFANDESGRKGPFGLTLGKHERAKFRLCGTEPLK